MYYVCTKPLYKNQVKRNKTEPVAKFRASSQLWLVQPVTTYIFRDIFNTWFLVHGGVSYLHLRNLSGQSKSHRVRRRLTRLSGQAQGNFPGQLACQPCFEQTCSATPRSYLGLPITPSKPARNARLCRLNGSPKSIHLHFQSKKLSKNTSKHIKKLEQHTAYVNLWNHSEISRTLDTECGYIF